MRPHVAVSLAVIPVLATACSGSDAATNAGPTWHNTGINAVSKTSSAAGMIAVTALGAKGSLETVSLDAATGRRLWSHPATMAGRLPGMGVQPPALVAAQGKAVVAALDPAKKGKKWRATLIVRDARTGRQLWERPIHSTFGPQRCGEQLCLADHTALKQARFVVLDPLTGKELWKTPGAGEVLWADAKRVVFLRYAKKPSIEARELSGKGKAVWATPIGDALGPHVTLAGGWSFGTTEDRLVGYVAPYRDPKDKDGASTRRPQDSKPASFGMFALRLADGEIDWMRPGVVRVYPSGNPAAGMVVRPVNGKGQYGGFAHIDGPSGKVTGQITAGQVPAAGWWLAFSDDSRRLGFLRQGAAGEVYDLTKGARLEAKEQRGWSFCVRDPQKLQIGTPGDFYPVAALCRFDLATGKRVPTTEAPPAWYTGRQDGWRIWRDEKGALHGLKDGSGSSPGMYG